MKHTIDQAGWDWSSQILPSLSASGTASLLDSHSYSILVRMGDSLIGFLGIGTAVLFFGSNFIPIKKYETGDGMFFQFVVCMGICR